MSISLKLTSYFLQEALVFFKLVTQYHKFSNYIFLYFSRLLSNISGLKTLWQLQKKGKWNIKFKSATQRSHFSSILRFHLRGGGYMYQTKGNHFHTKNIKKNPWNIECKKPYIKYVKNIYINESNILLQNLF